MKNLKKLIATVTLTGIIILGTTNAQAGLLMSDFAGTGDTNQPCTTKVEKKSSKRYDNGIIVSLTGIIVSLTGIIVSYNETPTNCGIIVSKS